jgi:hypothetical protein
MEVAAAATVLAAPACASESLTPLGPPGWAVEVGAMSRPLSRKQAAFQHAPGDQDRCRCPDPPGQTDGGCLAERHSH